MLRKIPLAALTLFLAVNFISAQTASCDSQSFQGVCILHINEITASSTAIGDPTTGTVGSIIGDPRDGHSHQGIDIFNKVGTPVVAFEAGVVVIANNAGSGLCGKEVSVKHPDGRRSIYCHLDTVAVSQGQRISKGQRLGTMGKTGNAHDTPPHLHFEIRLGSAIIDPCTLLECRRGSALTA
ncbi:M23 family metallopeptidase [Candidatus Micrarchaeota archaeon]|nr:M23 family metallopeptidase [Candidatus Micrarchaeota archaeon]